MTKVLVLGAAGSLGRQVVRLSVEAGHVTTALARDPAKLATDLRSRMTAERADLRDLPIARLTELAADADVLCNAAGTVSEGAAFVALVDRVVTAVEALPVDKRPVCWLLAGAAALDLAPGLGRGVDLPMLRKLYWPHSVNHARLAASSLDWRLLCPGPMTEAPSVGVARLRSSVDRLPVPYPEAARVLPRLFRLALLGARMPQMIVPFVDAAGFMLTNIEAASPFSRRRVGLALPVGMTGRKDRWRARPNPEARSEATLKRSPPSSS